MKVQPDGVQKTDHFKFSINSFPVVSLSLSDKDGGDLEQLTRPRTESDIQPALEDIDGCRPGTGFRSICQRRSN